MSDHHHQESAETATWDAISLDRRLVFSILLNALIVVVQLIGGMLSGSLALLSDAVHNASDVAALTAALIARRLSRRPPTPSHTYGLRRIELVVALANGATLLVASTLIVREAVRRFAAPEPVRADMMLFVAAIGLVANLVSVLLLRGHGHSDLNMRAAFLHLLQDTGSSLVVVLAAVLVLSGWEGALLADPIASLVVAVAVLFSGWQLLKATLNVLLEATPPGMDLEELQRQFEAAFPDMTLHHLHVWQVVPGRIYLTSHVRLSDRSLAEAETACQAAAEWLEHEWGIAHATLQPEVEVCEDDSLIRGSDKPKPSPPD